MPENERYFGQHESIEPDKSANLMTDDAYEFLKRSLQDAEDHLKEAHRSVGEAGDTSDWHDNFAFDEAHRQIDLWSSVVRMRRSQMENVVFIPPRIETERVGLGNAVELRFQGEEESETFLILGSVDAMFRKNCLSYQTPVGHRILGQPAGKTIEFEIDGEKTRVKIVKILQGIF